jgi:hypothetical protein
MVKGINMNFRKIIFQAVCIFVFSSQFLEAFGKLNYYSCSNHQDKKSCSASCKKRSNDYSHEFLVNSSNNSVIFNTFIKDRLTKSEPYENCKVVDKNNWVCSLMGWNPRLQENYEISRLIMSNGVYFVSEEHGSGVRDFPAWCFK